jgi:phosphotransferase system enzyme I (PtsI)
MTQRQEILLIGTPICRGIAIGKPFFFTFVEDTVPEFSIPAADIEMEIERYRRAVARGKEDIKLLQKQLERERIMEGASILDAHLEMMQDPLLTTNIEKQIRQSRKNAEYVFQSSIKQYQKKFNAIADPFFRERFKDIQDISRRVLGYLRDSIRMSLADIPEDTIIFATDLLASDTAQANSNYIVAFVTEAGGATSHAAIIAKAKGIPYVSSVDFSRIDVAKDGLVIVDGRTGEIILNPGEDTLVKYQALRNQLHFHFQKLREVGRLEAETYDGYKVQLSANIEMFVELDMLHQFGGNGVGLFRSEYIFLSRETLPSEEEQFDIYRRFVERMDGLPIVIRTFDLGGDKYLLNQPASQEGNPFLGCRAIRFLLREKEIFKTQLRAILRASHFGNVSLMFPMVSSLTELLEAKNIVAEVRQQLMSAGERIAPHTPIGCMIEVPSAAIIADLLARECDFLSIGTNDLVQYSLAVDRSNHALSSLYTPTHPGIIRLIKHVVSEANQLGIPVAICGEVAADPRFTPLLLGLGVHELSVASRYIPIVKNAIRCTSIVAASKLAEKALTLSCASEIEHLLTMEYRKNVPEDCFYNVK